ALPTSGPGARPGPMRSERDAPAVERAGITLAVVLHAQVPLAIETLAGQIDGVGLVDVVGAAAGAVVQLVHAAVRRDQVDLEVADVGVGDVDRDVGLGQAAAAAAGNVDRAAEHLAVVDGEVVTVGVGLNFVVAGITGVAVVTLVLADQGDAAVRLVSLDADVVPALLRGRELAHFRVAGLVRTAVPDRVGGFLAELHVQVRITGATGDGEDQVRRAGRDVQPVAQRMVGADLHVGHRHAVLQGNRIRVGRRAAAAFNVDAGERGGHVGLGVAQVLGRGLDAAGAVVEVGARGPVVAVGGGEDHERLVGVPTGGIGEQVEGLVVDARRVVDVEAVVVVVGAADRDAVEGRILHVAQRFARRLEDLAADQEVVLALEEELRGLAGHVGERLVDTARLERVLEVGVLLGETV